MLIVEYWDYESLDKMIIFIMLNYCKTWLIEFLFTTISIENIEFITSQIFYICGSKLN